MPQFLTEYFDTLFIQSGTLVKKISVLAKDFKEKFSGLTFLVEKGSICDIRSGKGAAGRLKW